MIYWDLDGVLRGLSEAAFGEEPTDWHQKKDGKGLVELVNDNKNLLLEAKPLPYLSVAIELGEVVVLSHQPESWRARSNEWLDRHIGWDYKVYYVNSFEEKLSFLRPGDALIDDYPFEAETDYSIPPALITVDKPYNKNKGGLVRVKNVDELRHVLSHWPGDKKPDEFYPGKIITADTAGGFVKNNQGKTEWHMLSDDTMEEVVRVLMHGAKKYAPDNWKKCNDPYTYYDAARRHMKAWKGGEYFDKDSGYPHLAHAICSLMFQNELDKINKRR